MAPYGIFQCSYEIKMRCSTGANGFVACWMFANERLVRDGGKLSKNKRKNKQHEQQRAKVSNNMVHYFYYVPPFTPPYPSTKTSVGARWGRIVTSAHLQTCACPRVVEVTGNQQTAVCSENHYDF